MNNRFLGNSPSLTKYDLLMQLATAYNLSAFYVSMITEPETRNKGDRNATNYRLGSKNESLLNLMKTLFHGDDSSITDVFDHLRENKISLKAIATRNNLKAGNHRIGYINHFNHKERAPYLEGVAELIDKKTDQVIFLDPDTGIMPSYKKFSSGKTSSFLISTELKAILDVVSDSTIIMAHQLLTNHLYTHEDRVKDLQKDLQPNIILLVDEVVQSGVYFLTKNNAAHKKLAEFLWDYLKTYQFVKSNERVMLVIGNDEGVTIKHLGTISKENAQGQ